MISRLSGDELLKGRRAGYVVTGGQDAIVNIFSVASAKDEPNFSLLGHEGNVCTLDVFPDGTIVSGSWDKCVQPPMWPLESG